MLGARPLATEPRPLGPGEPAPAVGSLPYRGLLAEPWPAAQLQAPAVAAVWVAGPATQSCRPGTATTGQAPGLW